MVRFLGVCVAVHFRVILDDNYSYRPKFLLFIQILIFFIIQIFIFFIIQILIYSNTYFLYYSNTFFIQILFKFKYLFYSNTYLFKYFLNSNTYFIQILFFVLHQDKNLRSIRHKKHFFVLFQGIFVLYQGILQAHNKRAPNESSAHGGLKMRYVAKVPR